jgi:hypothetical protein
MCPEAYTIHDVMRTYIANGDLQSIRNSGAAAYSKYLKCNLNAAKKLLVN